MCVVCVSVYVCVCVCGVCVCVYVCVCGVCVCVCVWCVCVCVVCVCVCVSVCVSVCVINLLYVGFPGGSNSKESACNAGDSGSIPGLGRSPGEGNGYPLQYSCPENSMDRGAW